MRGKIKKYTTIQEYHSDFPGPIREKLDKMYATIKKAAPKAKEVISYNMPGFKGNKVLVFYAAFKNHIGLYPTSSGVEMFRKELAGYETSKGAIQFPLDKPIPLTLVREIVRFRVAEDESTTKMKKAGKKY